MPACRPRCPAPIQQCIRAAGPAGQGRAAPAGFSRDAAAGYTYTLSLVGNPRADLPSGERPCLCSFRPHVHRFHAARNAKDRSELRTPAWTVAPALTLSVACGTLAGRPLARQGRRRFASGCSSHAAASGSFYQQTKPPSTRRLTPVQNVDAWLARKTAGPIISSTVAIRPRGGVTPIGMATPL